MTAKEFVDQLKDLIPDAQTLTNSGRSAAYIEQHIIGTYDLTPISNNYSNFRNEIQNLIQNYDTQYKGWLYLELDDLLSDNNGFTQFGSAEGDLLIYDPKSKKVYLADHEYFDQIEILFDVAENDTKFLDALLILAEYQMNISMKEIQAEDNEAKINYAKRAAEAAGGKPYLRFYNSVLYVE